MLERDPGRVRAIVSALSDEYSKKILVATIKDAKSPEEISTEQEIPVSTCYRKIHDLVRLSILRIGKIEIKDGKKMVYYTSEYKNMLIKFESNRLLVELVPNIDSSSISSSNNDANTRTPSTIHDCDICMSKNVQCTSYASNESSCCIYVCQKCVKRIIGKNDCKPLANMLARTLI